MKIYKTSLIVALVAGGLLAWSTLASAQDTKQGKKGRGPNIERQMDRLTTELNLTDPQKPKVKAVLEDTAKKRRDISRDLSGEERRAKMRPITEEQNKKIKEILTPDQYEKYQKLQQQQRRRGAERKAESK